MKEEENQRLNLLKKLEDLKQKIESKEPFPHGPQDISSLIDMSEHIDDCLNGWYY